MLFLKLGHKKIVVSTLSFSSLSLSISLSLSPSLFLLVILREVRCPVRRTLRQHLGASCGEALRPPLGTQRGTEAYDNHMTELEVDPPVLVTPALADILPTTL